MTRSILLRRVLVAVLAAILALGLAELGSVATRAEAAGASHTCSSASKSAKAKKAKSKAKTKAKKAKKSKKAKHKRKKKHGKAKRRCTPTKPAPTKPTPTKTTSPAPSTTPADPTTSPSVPTTTPSVPDPTDALSLGPGGMVPFTGNQTVAWINSHPNDPRTPTFRNALLGKATSLWLTGDESFGNLGSYVRTTRDKQGTMVLTIWNIPLRWDGLSTPSAVASDAYRTWLTKIAKMIGDTRAILVLEPDALWFYDRLPNAAAKAQRLEALQSAITALRTYATNTRVYLEAGTTSGSVTPERMGQILDLAGVRQIAGFAVNASSFSPTDKIEAYAGRIRAELQRRGVSDARFVVDTARNGAPTWDYTWCNPDGRRIGAAPGLVGSATGYDYRLWIKGPGTSDGNCGNGKGSNGGDFLPAVAYAQIVG